MKLNETEQDLVHQLEQIIGAPVYISDSVSTLSSEYFQLRLPSGNWIFIQTSLSTREKKLIEWVIDERHQQMKRWNPQGSVTLAGWLQQLKERDVTFYVPVSIQQLDWNRRVPMLIESEGQIDKSIQSELKELLEGYFQEQGAWITEMRTGEWLILVSESHFTSEENGSRDVLDLSVQVAEGLAEAIYSEIGIKVRVIVDRSISSPKEVEGMWERLLQSIQLAKTYHKQQQVHVTWQFDLEQLLENLDEKAVEQFLAQLRSPEMFQEKETRRTIEAFFKLNLNVSETARQLFIHRNTLLYRLDRIKQETGLDLRQFEDAVLAKIALLLTAVEEDM